jgi:hypothetical protein
MQHLTRRIDSPLQFPVQLALELLGDGGADVLERTLRRTDPTDIRSKRM